jgi:hypothetical protein
MRPRTLTFTVVEPRRPPQDIEVELERLLIGSGAHCDIRLPVESAAHEHVVIVADEEAIIAHLVAPEGIAFFDGEARRQWGLVVGSTIRIDVVEITLQAVRERGVAPRRPNHGPKVASAVAVLVMLAAAALFRNASAEVAFSVPKAPSPFAAMSQDPTCPEKQAAAAVARQKLAVARSKRERFRFYPRDGVEAVSLYRTALACLSAAGDEAMARTVQQEATALASQIEDDLHGSRVALERALTRKDARTAMAEVRLQREILSRNADGDPYLVWLALLQSKLEAGISKE